MHISREAGREENWAAAHCAAMGERLKGDSRAAAALDCLGAQQPLHLVLGLGLHAHSG